MLGSHVRYYRRKLRLTQGMLGERIGTTQSVISEVETGTRANVTMEFVGRLALALGVTSADLLQPQPPQDIDEPPRDLLRDTGWDAETIETLIQKWATLTAQDKLDFLAMIREAIAEERRRKERQERARSLLYQ